MRGDCSAALYRPPWRRPSTVMLAWLVVRANTPSPSCSASTAPSAIVAWPQNGTSASGAK
ncbi:Uncharacterised protein [Bordetella pertussis]|nr:Uncharacterised protein [Bordetella pertussis]CFW50566.1 Uncharacterised protein [Bordetella pertussis]